jgi:hypothetical protein
MFKAVPPVANQTGMARKVPGRRAENISTFPHNRGKSHFVAGIRSQN